MTGLWLLAATPLPAPTIDAASKLGSPGFAGFVATGALAVAVILLVRSLVGHLRRVDQSPDPGEQPGPDGTQRPDPGEQPGPDGTQRPEPGPDSAQPPEPSR
jgi:hypothetical protein